MWGKGYILKLQEILKKYIFKTLCFNRLHGITMINNERTISSILSCGMTNEGVLRDYYCKNGEYVDGWTYSMLKKEYLKENEIITNKHFKINDNEIIELISSVISEENIDINSSMDNTYSWDSMTHLKLIN